MWFRHHRQGYRLRSVSVIHLPHGQVLLIHQRVTIEISLGRPQTGPTLAQATLPQQKVVAIDIQITIGIASNANR